VRWRERRQARILEMLRATLQHARLAEAHLTPVSKVSHVSSDQIVIDVEERSIPEDALGLGALGKKTETALDAQVTTVVVDCHPKVLRLDLLDGDAFRLFKADPTINPPSLHKFGFPARREDRGLFGSQGVSAQPATRLRPIPNVPREPDREKREPLEERLRWILTPPIHELLSDPSLGLPETPYDYQVRGIAWLRGRNNALLADEMGLGKTMQAIITARLLWREKAINWILVVCPKTLVSTWRNEIKKWWPNACPNISEPSRDTQWFLKLNRTSEKGK